MSIKDVVNSGLRRSTGLSLTRETAADRRAITQAAVAKAVAAAVERTRAEEKAKSDARSARQRAKAKARVAEVRAAHERSEADRRERNAARAEANRLAKEERFRTGADLPASYDDHTRSTIARVRPWTMTSHLKLYAAVEAVRHVVRAGIPGEIVECGVWRGGSMQAMALTLIEQGDTGRELHLFDTFEGMPPPTDEDVYERGGERRTAAQMLAEAPKDSRMWAVADLDDVRSGMDAIGYPAERIHYHPGMVEDTVPGQAPGTIALLRLDTDWYASTKHELETLYERLSPGGLLLIDDYGDWEGARKAVDEWMATSGQHLFLAPMGTGRIAVKPR